MSPSAISVADDSPDSGTETVLTWRTDTLLRAGFGSHGAVKPALAEDVDLHEAVSLVKRGCSPQTALRILL